MSRWLLIALLLSACSSSAGTTDAGPMGAMDAFRPLDAPGLDAPGSDAPGSDAGPPPECVAASTKAVLEQSDFTYLGAFMMPPATATGDAPYGNGLTHRYVGGELRLLSASWNPQDVFEVSVPALATAAPYEVATVVREWGDVYGSHLSGDQYGLHWDAVDQRLYWSGGIDYNATSTDDPSVGYARLDDATGTATPVGVWGIADHGYKSFMGGMLDIPAWFAAACTDGRRLGVGFGGYHSIITNGEVSLGPTLAAIDPPSSPSGSALPNNYLLGYPFSNSPIDCVHRAERDTDYTDDYDHCDPAGGVGHFTWSDYIGQSAVWIDTPARSGLVVIPNIGNGRVWYETSTLHAERSSIWWLVYDPTDLARVAAGAAQASEIQPVSRWNAELPELGASLPGWRDGPENMVSGVTYDATTGRLYVRVKQAIRVDDRGAPLVYVYEVRQ